MGADLSKTSRSDINPEDIQLKELGPKAISKLRQSLIKGSSSIRMDRSKLMSLTGIGQRESDILFEYFDMDGDGQIDDYELTCAIAMIIYSSIDLKSEFIFKLYDFDSNNYLTKNELYNLVITMTLYKKRPLISSNIDEKTDEILREADLDLDKKLSLREFKAYAYRNREIIGFLDAYEPLIGNSFTERKKAIKEELSDNNDEEESKTQSLVINDVISQNTINKKNKNNDNEKENETNNNNDNETNNEIESQNNENTENFEEEDILNLGDEVIDPDLKAELNKDILAEERNEKNIENIKKGVDYGNGFFEEYSPEGDQFAAIKPWKTNVINCIPNHYKKSKLDGTLPDAELELELVYGYRSNDTRNNLRYTKNGKFVYHTAAVGIVYDKEKILN